MEGVDWVMNNGRWVETFVEKSQHEIKKASKSQLESTKLRIFENFMKKI